MNGLPRIVSAAMLMDDGCVVPGVRHYSTDMRAILLRLYGSGIKVFGCWLKKPYHLRVREQGFIDARGAFLSREDAWRVAAAQGQVFVRDAGGKIIARPYGLEPCGRLYSENLY